jgi:hypothetical protein
MNISNATRRLRTLAPGCDAGSSRTEGEQAPSPWAAIVRCGELLIAPPAGLRPRIWRRPECRIAHDVASLDVPSPGHSVLGGSPDPIGSSQPDAALPCAGSKCLPPRHTPQTMASALLMQCPRAFIADLPAARLRA